MYLITGRDRFSTISISFTYAFRQPTIGYWEIVPVQGHDHWDIACEMRPSWTVRYSLGSG